MENLFTLTALLQPRGEIRYTPAGIPVLDVTLKHESWQDENGGRCLIKFDLPAKIIGKEASVWQHRCNQMVTVSGFLAQKSHRSPYPMLRIQNIQEYKG